MAFFSTHLRRPERLTITPRLFYWRFSVTIACLLSLALIYILVPALPALATTHSLQGHPITLQALRQQLKRTIHITHTGHVSTTHTAPHLAANTLPTYNNIGISDNTNPAAANFDGSGNSYSEQDFTNPSSAGWNPGDTLTYEGLNYIWPAVPAGQSDNYVSNGQTIPVTPVPGALTIGFVGSADQAPNGVSGKATLTYTDGTTKTFSLGMSNWTLNNGNAIPLASNHYFAVLPHINNSQGQKNTSAYLFEMETPLIAGKTLQSVTLPHASTKGRLHIFMIGTRASNDFMNNVGTSDDNYHLFANYDGNRDSYSTQALEANNIIDGQPFLFNGVSFPWTASYSVIPDNYQAAGQTIPLAPVANATTLAFLGSATHTNSKAISSGKATITYTDGTIQTFTLSLTNWGNATALSGNLIAATCSYINTLTGTSTGTYHLYYTDVTLQAGKTIQSVTLPSTVSSGKMHIFSVGLK
jgi:hypothetical protein